MFIILIILVTFNFCQKATSESKFYTDCGKNCDEEKSFRCFGYYASNTENFCLLFNDDGKPKMKIIYSKCNSHDLDCQDEMSSEAVLCEWHKEKTNVSAKSGMGFSRQYKKYRTENEYHCQQLCNMQYSLNKSKSCGALIFESNYNNTLSNCYLLRPLEDGELDSFDDGDGDLYIQTCSSEDETNAK